MNVSSYINTEKLKFTIEFITPCFLGGADGNAEIRTAPFKDCLRYWWRALYGPKYDTAEKLKSAEDYIFGSSNSDEKKNVGKSKVQIQIEDQENVKYQDEKTIKSFTEIGYGSDKDYESISKRDKDHVKIGERINRMNILNYLALGKFNIEDFNDLKNNGKPQKKNYRFIKPGSMITLKVRISSEVKDEVMDALKFFILFGGIGGKSRNGFGSMYSKELYDYFWSKNLSFENEKQVIPVLSKEIKYFETKRNDYNSWHEALFEIGEVYRNTRITIESKHHYDKRGLIARPIIPNSYNDEILNDKGFPTKDRTHFSKDDRFPKNFYMGVKKNSDEDKPTFTGYILVLPIVFYNDKKGRNYNEGDYEYVVSKMCKGFVKNGLNDKTKDFKNEIRGAR